MDLAQSYVYAGNPDQSIKTYEQVLALEPNNSEARYDMAIIYYYSSKYDPAVAQLQELLKNDPNNKDAHYLYGIVLGTGKNDYQGGIQELEKFIELAKEGSDVEKARQLINEWKNPPAK
jgi:tetratricopeptide (TPR) repeat protein